MPERNSFDYAIIRLVPHEERGEFINAGVILYCRAAGFLDARIAFDAQRLKSLDADVDAEVVRRQLEAIPRICAGKPDAGPLSALSQGERFFWLVAARNTIVQASPLHTGLCDNPAGMLDHLLETMVNR
jgi:hypothetical protein